MSVCLLLALFLCITMIMTNLIKKLNKFTNLNQVKTQELINDFIFSNIRIVDSKFIGLFIFILSNLLTGIVNLTINTLKVDNLYSLAIIDVYIAVIIYFSYSIYSRLQPKSKKHD